jgi:hypothetical protein
MFCKLNGKCTYTTQARVLRKDEKAHSHPSGPLNRRQADIKLTNELVATGMFLTFRA